MFNKLANFASKYRFLIIVGWIVLAAGLFVFAPAISKVGVIDDSQFLPQDTQSSQARKILEEKFAGPAEAPAGSAVIVIYNPQGISKEDEAFGVKVQSWLVSSEAPDIITSVVSIFENEALRSVLLSQDGTTTLMELQLSEASSSADSRQAVEDIRSYITTLNGNTQIYVTGNAGISHDLITSVQHTIDRTTLVTIILVIVLLLIIYRSPVAIFVPLLTIGVSYLVARGVVGYMASLGVAVSSLMDAYLVVLLFGIGTDYCLFMVSRFKEELVTNGKDKAEKISFRHIGPVIVASAITVVAVLLCLGISRFGLNRTSGFSLAIGVAITLAASVTLTPALISLLGEKVLWPGKLQRDSHKQSGGFWENIGRKITRNPALFLIPIVIVLTLPYLALVGIHTSAETVSQMPEDIESVRGFNLISSHFPAGETAPTYVLLESKSNLMQSGFLVEIGKLAASIKEIDEVSSVSYISAPVADLLALGKNSRKFGDVAASGDITQLVFFRTLGQDLSDLAVNYPGVTQSANFNGAVANLSDISARVADLQGGGPQNATSLLAQIRQLAYSIADNLDALSSEFSLEVETPFTAWLKSTFFSSDGSITKINVILGVDPYSKDAISAINRIRETVSNSLQTSSLNDALYYAGGETAVQADILAINGSDFLRVLALAVVGVLIVTIILLRSLVAPLYMVLTVLFNFGATMGISTWLFLDVLKQNSVIYMLPIFVFVILVAVGADYNIFLVSRIREETATKPLKEAVCQAVANTGGVITACGIILAGTFGTLMIAPLQLVFQVGAAIAIGVLIDTFLVRALLIPSIATLAGRWSWWPSTLSKQKPRSEYRQS